MVVVERLRVRDVFTPTTPARVTFVDRERLNDQLVDALRTPGKQVVVYGPSGSGKTTLLVNKLAQLYPQNITSRCTAATTFESLLVTAFDSLDVYYSSGASIRRGKSVSVKLEQAYFGIKSSIEAATTTQTDLNFTRLLPPQLTPQRLAEFCGAAECCWVLEDFHKVGVGEKAKLSQIMKVFMDSAATYPDVKIIAIGAVDSAREVIQYDPEMRNRVAEIAVPLMTQEELTQVLTKGEDSLNLKFGTLRSEIASYSSGLASVCHQLGLNICFAAGIEETCEGIQEITTDQLQTALQRYLNDASDTLKAVFDLALKQRRVRTFDNARLILRALTEFGEAGGTHSDLLKKIHRAEATYPPSNLTFYLRELQTTKHGEITRFDPTSGRYFFRDPLYLAYARCLFVSPGATLEWLSAVQTSVQRLLTERLIKWKKDSVPPSVAF